MYELAIEELMEYLTLQINSTHLKFKATQATRDTLESLLPSKSISEIYAFIWQAVKRASEAFEKNRAKGAVRAANFIPSNISTAAERFESRAKEKPFRTFERPSATKPCEISNTVYALILGDFDGAFKIPLPRYINEVMRPTLEGIVSAEEAKAAMYKRAQHRGF
jgi:hypothetical protein